MRKKRKRARKRSPRNFLILATIAAFATGIILAVFSVPEEYVVPVVPRTSTRVEQPFKEEAKLPDPAKPDEVPADPEPKTDNADKPQEPDEPQVQTLPPRELDPQTMPRKGPAQKPRGLAQRKGIVILQIGDSHTAADFLTGELRRLLQAKYGDGGAGYMSAGRPHIGVRSSAFVIKASSGWTYESLQRTSNAAKFWLSGFNASAEEAGETLTFSSERPFNFDRIEIQALRQPKGGTIEIRLDGVLQSEVSLSGEAIEPVVIQLMPERAATDRVREITITTKGEGKVNLSSVAVHNRQFGLSYNNVGFPGATVDIVNKFDDAILDNELKRLDPQIVVLAFGTNEGFNDGLDPAVYERSYERALNKIRRALPDAKIVIVAPPDAARGPKKDPEKNAKTNGDTKDTPEKKADGEKKQAPPVAEASEKNGCNQWKTPPQLNKVREVQEIIAKRHGLVYWNWASIMPSECAADRWANASPPLLAKDRVHFTLEGYRRSAVQFLKALEPLIEQVRKANDVVSNH